MEGSFFSRDDFSKEVGGPLSKYRSDEILKERLARSFGTNRQTDTMLLALKLLKQFFLNYRLKKRTFMTISMMMIYMKNIQRVTTIKKTSRQRAHPTLK